MIRTLARCTVLASLAALPLVTVIGGVTPASAAPQCYFSADRPAPGCGGGVTSIALTPPTARTGPGGHVSYNVVAGSTDVTSSTVFSITDGTCSANVCSATDLGDHVVTAAYNGYTRTATLSVDRLAVSPTFTSVVAGQSVPYTVSEIAADGTVIADLTSVATVTMDGAVCPGLVCTPTSTGEKTITATYGSLFGGGALSVTPGAPVSLALTPPVTQGSLGQPRTYAATTVDAYGNVIADVSAQTSFAIAPDGYCAAQTCAAGALGEHAVTGTFGGLIGTARLVAAGVPYLISGPLPAGTVGKPYLQQLVAAPGFPAPTVSLVSGNLPTGLALSRTGQLSGTPTSRGTWTFVVGAGNDAGDTSTTYAVTIAPAAAPSLSIAGTQTLEGASRHVVRLTVSLLWPSTGTVKVHWGTANGTARAGSDYVAASGTLTFAPGQITASIPVTVIGDRAREANETLKVTLSRPIGAVIGTAQAQLTIVNDD